MLSKVSIPNITAGKTAATSPELKTGGDESGHSAALERFFAQPEFSSACVSESRMTAVTRNQSGRDQFNGLRRATQTFGFQDSGEGSRLVLEID